MKKNQFPIAVLISTLVILFFIPLNECRSELITTGGSMQELQSVYSFDTDENNCAVSNDILNFEEKKIQNFSTLSSWSLIPAETPLYLIHISQAVEPRSLALNFERCPRPPPFINHCN